MQKKGNFATLSIESIGDHHSPESLILFILPYHQHYLGKCPLGFDAAYLSPRLVFGEHLQNPPHLYNGSSGFHFFPVDFPSAQPRNRPGLFLGFPAMCCCWKSWKPWKPPRENHPMIH